MEYPHFRGRVAEKLQQEFHLLRRDYYVVWFLHTLLGTLERELREGEGESFVNATQKMAESKATNMSTYNTARISSSNN